MFLDEILKHVPVGRNRYADSILASERAGQPVAGIWRLFAWRPALAVHLSNLAQEVLRGPSTLSPGFRETIAAFVSARNHCLF
jgi:hypothetical protein